MAKFSAYCLVLFIMFSCDSKSIYSEYKSISNSWGKDEKITFQFKAPDSVQPYNIFVNLRNNEEYKYSNLFLIVNLDFPDNETITDTLEYMMAEPNGEWLGKGFSSLKESKLWYKENVVFPRNGEYKITVEQAMRKVGSVEGIQELDGITDIGIKIEKANKE
ncbi:gliding motility-associated lipoprotein GldH [Zhouia amylolytica]|nr:gliding motility lipoprotein GldH [Zhouia amylolytica]MCQ0112351.1 gliding motility lipoprotein GldH [Zhouia amylolytica]SFS41198.1 gliding motility-associated lipoprotein GldH [Zhouia amylolytica]